MVYVVVVTSRNEEDYVEKVLSKIVVQTVKPALIVFIDDGSTDDTYIKAHKLSHSFNNLKVVSIAIPRFKELFMNRRYSFMIGVKEATKILPHWNFLLKVDCDHVIPINYAELLLNMMELNTNLGTVSGALTNSRTIAANGAILYRRKCWDDIGVIRPLPGWDRQFILESMCKGWESRSIYVDGLMDLRPETNRNLGSWFAYGRARYLQGFPWFHTIATSIGRIKEKPFLFSQLSFILGHFYMWITRKKKPYSDRFYRFIYNYAMKDFGFKLSRFKKVLS